MALIDVHRLTYTYPAVNQPALRNISLQIKQGEFCAIIGNNGAGKSTLCYALTGFIPHFFHGTMDGNVQVAGVDTKKAELSEIVSLTGLAFQNPFNQISGAKFTVYEELGFGLENMGLPRDEMRRRIEWVMGLTGIQDLAERSPYALSGGQQQRVALASILVMKPKVLVLDEPTSQLDPIGTREVFQVIKSMSQEGITIVMAEHKLEWVAEFADQVLALEQGQIIRQGAPAEVLSDVELAARGLGLSRYTQAAHRATGLGLWPAGRRLPVNLAEADAGFRAVLQTNRK
jgi:energy-coupling factor transport system ATP-binding protein